jgi:hypothetical protein
MNDSDLIDILVLITMQKIKYIKEWHDPSSALFALNELEEKIIKRFANE